MLLTVLLAGFLSGVSSAQEPNQTVKTDGKIVEKATMDSDWVRALDKASPRSEKELLKWLPKTLFNLPLGSSGSVETDSVEAMYSNDKKPTIRSKSVSLKIFDGAGKIGLEHMASYYNILHSDVSQTYRNTWGKTMSYKGMRVMVKGRKTEGRGSLPSMEDSTVEYIKDNRYFIILQGNDMDSTTLLKTVEEIEARSFPQ